MSEVFFEHWNSVEFEGEPDYNESTPALDDDEEFGVHFESEFTDAEFDQILYETGNWGRLATQEQKLKAWEKAGGKCTYCDMEVELDKSHADHIVPWSKFAVKRTSDANIICSCRYCNIAKGAMAYGDFKNNLAEKGLTWRNEQYVLQTAYFRRQLEESQGTYR